MSSLTPTFITTIIFSILTVWGLSQLSKKAKSNELKEENGKKTLRLPRLISSISKVILVLGVFLILTPIIKVFNSHNKLDLVFIIAGLFFTGIFFYLSFLSKNHFLTFSQNKITVQNILGQQKTIDIKSITKVKHNSLTNEVILKTQNGQKIKFSQFLSGSVNLCETIESCTQLDLTKIKSVLLFGKNNVA